MRRRQLSGDIERRQFERLAQKAEAWLASGRWIFRVALTTSVRPAVRSRLVEAAQRAGHLWWQTDAELLIAAHPARGFDDPR